MIIYSQKKGHYVLLEIYVNGKHYIWSEDLQCYCATVNKGSDNYLSENQKLL